MVNYLLDITPINPIDHHLPFEMFADEATTHIPCICIDVDSDNASEFITLMKKMYGNLMAPLFFEYTKPNGQRKRKIHYDQWVHV